MGGRAALFTGRLGPVVNKSELNVAKAWDFVARGDE